VRSLFFYFILFLVYTWYKAKQIKASAATKPQEHVYHGTPHGENRERKKVPQKDVSWCLVKNNKLPYLVTHAYFNLAVWESWGRDSDKQSCGGARGAAENPVGGFCIQYSGRAPIWHSRAICSDLLPSMTTWLRVSTCTWKTNNWKRLQPHEQTITIKRAASAGDHAVLFVNAVIAMCADWGFALREGVFAETKEGKCRNKREKS